MLTLLLSFIGQAWALPAVCTMVETEVSSVSTSPCHSMGMTEDSSITTEVQMSMDCCDSPMMADSSCFCPDGGTTGSVSFISNAVSSSCFSHDAINSFSMARFPSQISSALFRPPIV